MTIALPAHILDLVQEFARSLRKDSDGGKKITEGEGLKLALIAGQIATDILRAVEAGKAR